VLEFFIVYFFNCRLFPISDGDIVLTTDHLQGAFTIYLFGICVSFLVFLGELLVHKFKSGQMAKKKARKQPAKFQRQRFRKERK
jgi:hypothetical protein